jgi:beta-galactosidase
VKPIYAVAKADRVELFVNGKSLGDGEKSLNTLFTWPDIKFETGEIKAVAYRGGSEIASQVKQTAGDPVAIKLTAMTGPGGWMADGSDVALVDFEVVDAEGRRCPVDQGRVDFEVSGAGVWRGGYNSGTENSTNHLYLDTECGINRVSIRSTLEAGEFSITATRDGLKSATLKLESTPFAVDGGLANVLPAVFESSVAERPEIDAAALTELAELRAQPIDKTLTVDNANRAFSMFTYTGTGLGGNELPFSPEMLAFTDDARIFIKEVPEMLKDSTVIRTAKNDAGYWAADYIAATAGKEMDLYVAHDQKAPVPEWLKSFRKTKDKVRLNRGTMNVFTKRLKADEALRISGNVDQGKKAPRLNLILFCKPVN